MEIESLAVEFKFLQRQLQTQVETQTQTQEPIHNNHENRHLNPNPGSNSNSNYPDDLHMPIVSVNVVNQDELQVGDDSHEDLVTKVIYGHIAYAPDLGLGLGPGSDSNSDSGIRIPDSSSSSMSMSNATFAAMGDSPGSILPGQTFPLDLNFGFDSTMDLETILLPSNQYRHAVWAISLLVIAYTVILLLGVVGNSMVIITVFKTMRMRTVTNFFILNLALADLAVCIFCLPSTLIANIYVPWVLGWFMCKTVPYFQGVAVCASAYSLVAISLDRFLAIWFPLRCQITKKKACVVNIGIWTWSFTLALPWLFYFDLQPADTNHPQLLFCVDDWPGSLDGNIYYLVVNLGLFYLLPLFIISLCYFFIWLRVWRRHVPNDSHLSQIELIHQRAKVGVLKMLIVVVVCFILAWLPLYSIVTRYKLSKSQLSGLEEEIIAIAMPISQWLGSSNSCINPLLYGFLNVKFRRAFIRLFKGHQWTRNLSPHYEKGNALDVITLRKLHSRLSNTEMQRV